MKIEVYGKITKRSARTVKPQQGEDYQLYQIEIEEPGMFPSVFQLSSRDASLFGQKDGPLGVGNMVKITGFGNGRKRPATTREGKKFDAYSTWFTIHTITPLGKDTSAIEAARASAEAEQMADDIPF